MNIKKLLAGLLLGGTLLACPPQKLAAQSGDTATLKETMNRLQSVKGISFVYDSSIGVNLPYTGKPLDALPLKEALARLFGGTGIDWEIKGNYVVLRKATKKFTLHGYVFQPNGESLIGASVFDLANGLGTTTNNYGYFSFTLPEGIHRVRVSYVGLKDTLLLLNLDRNLSMNVYLNEHPFLKEVVVTGNLNSPLNTLQTGKVTLTRKELNTEFSLLSSPDLVKTLQRLPGVMSGTELISGLYVHGGTNDGNLFLLDGNPIYQVNHLFGLFSAFNTDVVKMVDFYKSAFPARYGGRLSSIVDVRTNDGDMKAFHGSFSIGLLDGRLQFEGPIVKDRTSFNIAMRRSWCDLMTATGFALYNRKNKDDYRNGRYTFQDINAKVTHRFSDRSRIFLSFYMGDDFMKLKNDTHSWNINLPNADEEHQYNKFRLQWGNLTTSMNWNYVFSPKLFSNLTAVYSRNRSLFRNYADDRYVKEGAFTGITHREDESRSVIDDIGYRSEFDYRPSTAHHIRFGSNYLYHMFRPQNNYTRNMSGAGNITPDTLVHHVSHAYDGHEFTLYAEDEITLLQGLKVNPGVHYTLFNIEGKTYHSVEPRLAMNVALSRDASVKVSYSEMSQFVHQLSNTYLNLPTDYWVPSTNRIRPQHSRQVSAGYYTRLPYRLSLAVEGFYKTMDRLLEYNGGNSLTPSVENWEELVHTGKGRSYGAELSLTYAGERLLLEGAYTLSWSERKFEAYNRGEWYADRFDNRHKLNLTGRYRFSRKIEGYASWTFHTGDRATVPTQRVEGPVLPGGTTGSGMHWVYETPNNLVMPAYHRLDLGVNFRHITKRGFERIWNVSVYNAYCRTNALFTRVKLRDDGTYVGVVTGVFPIIPSFSYTIKF